jgi:hypothetical protein
MGNESSTLGSLEGRYEKLRDDFSQLSFDKKSDPAVIHGYLNNCEGLQDELNKAISAKKVKLSKYSPEQLKQLTVTLHDELKRRLDDAIDEKSRAAAELKRKAEADKELSAARRAFRDAKEKWESDLKLARQAVIRYKNAKPQGGGMADFDPSVTAEGIAENLARSTAEVEALETKLQKAEKWKEGEILAWYRETEATKQKEAEAQRRTETLRAGKRDDPGLKRALAAMTSGLNFSVQVAIDPLLDAQLSQILVDPPPADNGESEALRLFKEVTSGVFPVSEALKAVADAGFPAGVRPVIEKLIKDETYGAGAGARLRSSIPKTVVHANAVGFNITNPAVQTFLQQVYRAMVTAMDSDSGSAPGDRFYRGEIKSKDLPT